MGVSPTRRELVAMLLGAFGYRVPPTGWTPAGWTAPPPTAEVAAPLISYQGTSYAGVPYQGITHDGLTYPNIRYQSTGYGGATLDGAPLTSVALTGTAITAWRQRLDRTWEQRTPDRLCVWDETRARVLSCTTVDLAVAPSPLAGTRWVTTLTSTNLINQEVTTFQATVELGAATSALGAVARDSSLALFGLPGSAAATAGCELVPQGTGGCVAPGGCRRNCDVWLYDVRLADVLDATGQPVPLCQDRQPAIDERRRQRVAGHVGRVDLAVARGELAAIAPGRQRELHVALAHVQEHRGGRLEQLEDRVAGLDHHVDHVGPQRDPVEAAAGHVGHDVTDDPGELGSAAMGLHLDRGAGIGGDLDVPADLAELVAVAGALDLERRVVLGESVPDVADVLERALHVVVQVDAVAIEGVDLDAAALGEHRHALRGLDYQVALADVREHDPAGGSAEEQRGHQRA